MIKTYVVIKSAKIFAIKARVNLCTPLAGQV